MITDHAYKPCHYDTSRRRPAAEALGLCLCPYGMHRCHVRGCGRKREEHASADDSENANEKGEKGGLP